MFDFDFEALGPELAAAPSPAGSFLADLQEVSVEIVTLGGSAVASLRLPVITTAQRLKERLAELVDMRPTEQRLVAEAQVFDGAQNLRDLLPPSARALQLTLLHVPGPRCMVVSGGRDGLLRLWDQDCGEVVRTLPGHDAGVTCLAVAWASRRAVTGGADALLRLWDLERGGTIQEIQGHRATVTCLAVDWDVELAISGDEDGALRFWDLRKRRPALELLGHSGAVLCVDLNVKANCAISGSADMTLRLWELESGEEFLFFPGHTPVNCLAANLSHKPNPITVAGSFAILRFWSLTQFPFHWDLPAHTGAVTCVAVEWESLWMVSGSNNATLLCGRMDLNSNTIEEKRVLRGHTMPVTCVQADWGRQLAISSSEDSSLRLWDLGQGNCLREFVGSSGGVLCVALEPQDGPPGEPDTPKAAAGERSMPASSAHSPSFYSAQRKNRQLFPQV